MLSLLVLQVLPIHLQGLHLLHDAHVCTMHGYNKPILQPVLSRSLILDVQVVTHLLGEYTLFAGANLYYPTTRLPHIFQQYS